MNNFFILHTENHDLFKQFTRRKKGSISISYEEVLKQQEKYLLFGEKPQYNVLRCELFNKIYLSISKMSNPKYHTIFYYMDTLDCNIIEDFLKTLNNYSNKLEIDLDISICYLEDLNPNYLCQKKLNLNQVHKEYIQQMF